MFYVLKDLVGGTIIGVVEDRTKDGCVVLVKMPTGQVLQLETKMGYAPASDGGQNVIEHAVSEKGS